MHVVILPSWYKDPEKPGSGIFFKQQAQALAECGINVAIVYFETRSLRAFSIKKLFKENFFQIQECFENGVREFCIKGWSPLPQTKIGMKLWVFFTKIVFRKYIQQYGKPDIIHAHSVIWGGYSGALLKSKYKIPLVITEHITAFNMENIPAWWGHYIKIGYTHADGKFAVSSILANSINRIYNFNIHVFPNFIDMSFFKEKFAKTLSKKENEFVFVAIGNLTIYKGYDVLIQAFNNAFGNSSNVKLYIAGIGDQEYQLKQLVIDLKLNEKVEFVGHLNREKIRDYLYLADVFVLASRVETFGIVFVEAMACGKPVIATICGGPEEFVTSDTGILVESEKVVQLTNALIDIKNNIHKFNSEKIVQYVSEKYDSHKLALQLIEFYKSIA